MKKIFLIFTILIIPVSCFASWFKLFSTSSGDLYIDTKSIKRGKNKITLSQLVDYKSQQPNGMLSLKVFSEVNCKNLSIKEINYEAYSDKMAMGTTLLKKKSKKTWKYPKKGTSAFFVNEILCDRIIK